MGRPVGYGSVKIIVTGVEERIANHNADGILNYEIKENQFASYEPFDIIIDDKTGENLIDFSSNAVEDLRTIVRYDLVAGKTVSYPIANDGKNTPNSLAAHHWFVSNRTQANRSQVAKFRYTLPLINSSDLTLPASGYFSTGNSSKPGGRLYSVNSHSAYHSGGYDKAVLSENTQYRAVLTDGSRTDNNNNIYCFITINGKRADTVRQKDLPDDMKRLPAEQLKGREISVVCMGKNGNYYRYRVIK